VLALPFATMGEEAAGGCCWAVEGTGVGVPRNEALGTKGVYVWLRPEEVEPDAAGVAAAGFAEDGVGVSVEATAAGAGVVAGGLGVEDDWNILSSSALLGLAFSAGFVAGVDVEGMVVVGVVAVGVDGLDGVTAALPLGGVLATIDPNVLTLPPCVFRVGTAAGEEDTGAETSSMDPKVTEEARWTGSVSDRTKAGWARRGAYPALRHWPRAGRR
jgi:hypothetical protein